MVLQGHTGRSRGLEGEGGDAAVVPVGRHEVGVALHSPFFEAGVAHGQGDHLVDSVVGDLVVAWKIAEVRDHVGDKTSGEAVCNQAEDDVFRFKPMRSKCEDFGSGEVGEKARWKVEIFVRGASAKDINSTWLSSRHRVDLVEG